MGRGGSTGRSFICIYTLCINDIGRKVESAKLHLYADDTVLHFTASNIQKAFQELQLAFNEIQKQLLYLKTCTELEKD